MIFLEKQFILKNEALKIILSKKALAFRGSVVDCLGLLARCFEKTFSIHESAMILVDIFGKKAYFEE